MHKKSEGASIDKGSEARGGRTFADRMMTSFLLNPGRRPAQSPWLFLLIGLALHGSTTGVTALSFCLDFSYRPKVENFKKFDFSIHGESSQANFASAQAAGKQFYGYISLGEVRANAPYLDAVRARGINFRGRNDEWNSYNVDLSDARWADFVIDTLAKAVVKKGYDGFFLDTLDTVETLMEDDPAHARSYRRGLVNLVQRLKAAYPAKKIITNRGFAVFDSLATTIDGMLVEELFQEDDYSPRPSHEVAELLDRIAPVTAAGLPVLIVDYVPRSELSLANKTAKRIARLGFYPCVIPREIDGTVLAPVPAEAPEPIKPVQTNYQITLPPGFSLIANQLNGRSNSIAEFLPSLPDGAVLYKFDNQKKAYGINTVIAGVWNDPAQTLVPGEGAFIFNPAGSNLTVERAGRMPSNSVVPFPGTGFSLLSCGQPVPARFEDVLGFAPLDGDRVFQFRDGHYETASFFGGQWDHVPAFQPGESFFVDLMPRTPALSESPASVGQ